MTQTGDEMIAKCAADDRVAAREYEELLTRYTNKEDYACLADGVFFCLWLRLTQWLLDYSTDALYLVRKVLQLQNQSGLDK